MIKRDSCTSTSISTEFALITRLVKVLLVDPLPLLLVGNENVSVILQNWYYNWVENVYKLGLFDMEFGENTFEANLKFHKLI